MSEVPPNTPTMEMISKWNDLQEKLAKIKAEEMLLRTALFKGLFVDPREGVNTLPLSTMHMDDWELKGERTINRKIDLPVLQAMAVPNGPLHIAGIRADDLVVWKPELNLKNYRELTAEQKLVFDQCLEIKDGSPQLKLQMTTAAKNRLKATGAAV
jgi:hypothetical protein